MARSKSYKRYASGGNPRNLQLAAGLRPMEEQTNRKVRQLEKLAGQQSTQSREYLQDMRGKLSREADNRKEVYEIEEVTPRKLRSEALKNNNIRQQENFKQRIKDQEDLAQVWADLSPTLARTLSETASTTVDFFQKRSSVEEYNKSVARGDIINISNFYAIQKAKKADELNKIIEQRAILLEKYKKTGKVEFKQEADYLRSLEKTSNPYTRSKRANDAIAMAPATVDDLISKMLTDEETGQLLADHKDIASHIQFRGMEVIYQLGLNPKSADGIKVQEKYRSLALTYEHQWSLRHEHASETDIINTNVEALGSSTTYEDKNNAFKNIFVSLSALPEQSRSGVWTEVFGKNKISEFESKAAELLQTPKYASNWELFKEEVLGKTLENPLGYVIVGAKGDLTKKHNRLLGKHPDLESRLLLEFEKANRDYTKAQQAKKESKDLNDATPFITAVDNGDYDGRPKDLLRDYWKFRHNPVVNKKLGNRLHFSDESINKGLYKSQIFNDMRSGITRTIVESWMTGPERDQDITWAHDNFYELADILNVEVNKLDDELLTTGKEKLTSLLNDNPLSTSRHESAGPIERDMAAFLLTYFVNNRGRFEEGTKGARAAWDTAQAQLNFMLGLDEKNVPVKADPDTGIRGHGEFRHREGSTGESRTVFLNNVGTVYNGTSAGEIRSVIDGDTEDAKGKQARLNYLINAVGVDAKDHFTDSFLLETKDTKGHPANHPILQQIYPHLNKFGISRKEFLGEVVKVRFPDSKDQKDKFVETIGSDWCDEHFKPAQNIKNPNDKIMAVCMDRVSKQTNIPKSFLALYASADPKVKEYLLEKRDKFQPGVTDGGE